MKCSKCGVDIPEDQKICGNCSGRIKIPPQSRSGQVKCPNCGFDNPKGRRFCEDCGSMIPRTPRIIKQSEERKKKGA